MKRQERRREKESMKKRKNKRSRVLNLLHWMNNKRERRKSFLLFSLLFFSSPILWGKSPRRSRNRKKAQTATAEAERRKRASQLSCFSLSRAHKQQTKEKQVEASSEESSLHFKTSEERRNPSPPPLLVPYSTRHTSSSSTGSYRSIHQSIDRQTSCGSLATGTEAQAAGKRILSVVKIWVLGKTVTFFSFLYRGGEPEGQSKPCGRGRLWWTYTRWGVHTPGRGEETRKQRKLLLLTTRKQGKRWSVWQTEHLEVSSPQGRIRRLL